MNNRQVAYLHEMGITPWKVRKPDLFDHNVKSKAMDISHFSLLILNSVTDLVNPLLLNILSAFKFSIDDVYCMSQAELNDYHGELPPLIWSMSTTDVIPDGYHVLKSAPLAELEKSPEEKKLLWEQFCAFNGS